MGLAVRVQDHAAHLLLLRSRQLDSGVRMAQQGIVPALLATIEQPVGASLYKSTKANAVSTLGNLTRTCSDRAHAVATHAAPTTITFGAQCALYVLCSQST